MDRVARCRRAAEEALADVEPPALAAVIAEVLEDASFTPGVLTLVSASEADPEADPEDLSSRAAAVQLIYEGLGLTRTLAREEPWADVTVDQAAVHAAPDSIRADLEIVAADVLVARGFYLLADTDAAETAVETVRSFGTDQTAHDRSTGTDAIGDSSLERDVLKLAVVAGTTAVGDTPSAACLELAGELADRSEGGFPAVDRWSSVPDPRTPEPTDGVPTDRATSATDH